MLYSVTSVVTYHRSRPGISISFKIALLNIPNSLDKLAKISRKCKIFLRSISKSKPFPFLSLPSELRLLVYAALVDNVLSTQFGFSFHALLSQGRWKTRRWPLLLVSKQVLEEFREVLLRRGPVEIRCRADPFRLRQPLCHLKNPSPALQSLRNLYIRLDLVSLCCSSIEATLIQRNVEDLLQLLSWFSQLNDVVIRIVLWSDSAVSAEELCQKLKERTSWSLGWKFQCAF